MENAVKALYMGAGMILGVMVLGVMIYMFRNGARFGETYETRKSVEQIQAFNAQFEVYERESEQNGESKGYSFITKGNTASDVISCANLAFDINSKNDYDLQNSVQVIIDMGSEKYYIYPFKVQKKNSFIKDMSFNSVKSTDESGGSIPNNKYFDFYKFLKDYNNVRIVNVTSSNYNSTSETMYEYYFDVDAEGIQYSDVIGKVNSITFKLFKTNEFDNTTCWVDNV